MVTFDVMTCHVVNRGTLRKLNHLQRSDLAYLSSPVSLLGTPLYAPFQARGGYKCPRFFKDFSDCYEKE